MFLKNNSLQAKCSTIKSASEDKTGKNCHPWISRRFKGKRCESEIPLFKWKVTLNNAYSPFK